MAIQKQRQNFVFWNPDGLSKRYFQVKCVCLANTTAQTNKPTKQMRSYKAVVDIVKSKHAPIDMFSLHEKEYFH